MKIETMFDNFLPKALFISLALHTAFICSTLVWQMPHVEQAKKRGVEISYKPQLIKKSADVKEHPIKPVQQLDLKSASMMPADGSLPLRMEKSSQSLGRNFVMHERKPERIRSSQVEHKISVTQIKSAKINNPAYAAYNEMVRSRIEEKAYANMGKIEEGTVYLTFIIGSDGVLKAAQIIDGKTNASKALIDSAMKSLKQAQFPPFLKGMTLPEYTFNLAVQYQIND